MQRSNVICHHMQNIKSLFHNIANEECLCAFNTNCRKNTFHPINVGFRWTAPYSKNKKKHIFLLHNVSLLWYFEKKNQNQIIM